VPKYDVAIIGAGLGSLAAAAFLSSRKKRVIIIERGPSLSDALGIVEKAGISFYAGPSLSYGFEPGGALQEFAKDLEIVQHTIGPSPCYQVALPDRRITIYSGQHETLEEIKREFPKEGEAVTAFYRDLTDLRTKSGKNRVAAFCTRHRLAAGFMRKYGFTRELTAFFDVQALSFFEKPAGKLSLASLMTLCDTLPRHLQGGFRKFGDQLYGVILQQGGEIRYNEPAPELILRNGRAIGVKTAQGAIEADHILLNALPQEHRLLLFAGLREDVIPVGMAQDVVVLPDYGNAQEFFTISLRGNEDHADDSKGMKALSASFQLQHNKQVDKQLLVEKLSRLIPFLKDYLVFAEDYSPEAGHAVLPDGLKSKPFHSKEGQSLLNRTSYMNVQVLYDKPEAPLLVLSAVRRYLERFV